VGGLNLTAVLLHNTQQEGRKTWQWAVQHYSNELSG